MRTGVSKERTKAAAPIVAKQVETATVTQNVRKKRDAQINAARDIVMKADDGAIALKAL
jgi:hypothetical protein